MRMLYFGAIPDGKALPAFPGIALGAIGIGLLATTGLAQASSIVVLGAATSTPSVVRLAAVGQISAASTPSIVALGDPVPAVTDEKVAAIPEKSRHAQTPMIIRGGVVGGAFATPAATASAKTTAPATPATGTAPATAIPANGTTAAAPNGETKAADNKAAANASGGHAQPQAKPKTPATLPPVGKAM
ncbi:hypothetical protein RFN28_16135 [Mesorhizobium sp. VK24D]|uniref:Uncharacterized protein n=1 Tax=Mesorhizobium album TaxID=3072314 RepID=A0ABU4XZ79_9HYPH|nr:hypothetical protein [Mesorhizobium sp. VK24D]MDX8480001.1 hypothetical protein [Mesorhizobium sp. VK24D]